VRQWYELTRMERLNVRADAHATAALEAHLQPSKSIHMIPSSKVALRIDAIDITSHYATHLRKAATRPAMLQRCHKHYEWTPAGFDLIDWKAHHGALQKLRFAEKKFVTKFIHQSLPMGAVFHKIDPSQPITCSSCQLQPESETHLYRCATRQAALEDTFLGDILPNFLQANHTCPRLAYTLLEALCCDLHDARYPVFTHRHGANDPDYRQLHQLQAFAGWSQLFQGRLVKEWGQLQAAFLARHHSAMKLDRGYYSGNIWTRKLISLLWGIMRAQWDHRNANRHGRTKEESESIRHARLMGQVINLYDQGPTMLAADRDVIAEPILAKAGRSPASLALWLECNTNIVKLSAKEATATIARTHQRIHSFFRSKRHTVLPPGLPPESIAPTSASAEGPPVIQAPTRKTRRSLDRSEPH
jgi:hypothetical protein